MPPTVAVVGAGVAGLAVSFELSKRASRLGSGLDVVCLEASERPGGNIRTDHDEGYLCEWGPNGFLDNVPATLAIVDRLGITDRLMPADRASP